MVQTEGVRSSATDATGESLVCCLTALELDQAVGVRRGRCDVRVSILNEAFDFPLGGFVSNARENIKDRWNALSPSQGTDQERLRLSSGAGEEHPRCCPDVLVLGAERRYQTFARYPRASDAESRPVPEQPSELGDTHVYTVAA